MALWAKSALNAVLFFMVFMVVLPRLAHYLVPLRLPIPMVVRTWLAGALAVVGVSGWVACLDTFSRGGRGTPLAADAPNRLVTTGLFGWVRNPIMLAELAVIFAEVLHFASWGLLIYAVAMTVVAQWLVVHVEEPELRARFGESYTDYCRKVPRWIPR
ncbi:MAG: isoprenylcysteine carboxylmethyltransferase family protein [Myxococcota bacterium]|nr:isoprenylcysteine carboxylmethyltransferase family protein [Myxococcota bacterium]